MIAGSIFTRFFCRIFTIILCLVSVSHAALAIDWDQAIENVEKNMELLLDKARELDAPFLGSMYVTIDAQEHHCSILGRMVGKTSYIDHLEKPLPTYSEDGTEFLVAHQSLSNWVTIARGLRSETQPSRIRLWNLDCVGKLNIPVSAYVEDGSNSMFYELRNEGATLRILGDIKPGFFEEFKKALDYNPAVKFIALGSHGGSIRDAMLAGFEIRRRGLGTTLWNNCYSACPFVFMGGVDRVIYMPFPDVGFHQISINGNAAPLNDEYYGLMSQYISTMGLDHNHIMRFVMSAKPHEMHIAEYGNLCDARFITWAQRICP